MAVKTPSVAEPRNKTLAASPVIPWAVNFSLRPCAESTGLLAGFWLSVGRKPR